MQSARLRIGLHRIATASLLAGWWGLLARVIHACFLRPPPRSLERTLESLADRPGPALVLILALGAGSGLRIALGSRSPVDATSLTAALAWLVLILA
jgi:hypothetical protein